MGIDFSGAAVGRKCAHGGGASVPPNGASRPGSGIARRYADSARTAAGIRPPAPARRQRRGGVPPQPRRCCAARTRRAVAAVPGRIQKGSDKTQDADEVQLCAQALCLEEMLCCAIPEGSLFYGESRRRTRVALDESLRARTLSLLAELLENQARGHTPSVRAHKGCNACSLKDVCVPRLSRTGSVRAYIHARIAEDSS